MRKHHIFIAFVVTLMCQPVLRAQQYSESAEFPLEATEWWSIFNDPLLDSLISVGENRNLDLKQALRRIEMSRSNIKSAQSGYYPTLSMSAGWSRDRESGYTTRQGGSSMTTSGFSLGVDMSWQIDLFGKVRAKVNQQKEAYRSTKAEYDWMCVTIGAEIASAYVNLRTLQQEYAVTEEHIEQQEKVLKITEARYEAGLASKLDVAQAKTVYYSTKASLCTIQTQISTTITSIAILIGEYPNKIESVLSVPSALPSAEVALEMNVSPELLANRPDVMEAQYVVDEYASALGLAKKDYLPTLSLTANVGTEAWHLKDMFRKNSFTYSVMPELSWTIFDGLQREANVAFSREQMMEAVDAYNLALLTAAQEVSNAIVTYRQAVRYEEEMKVVLENAQLAYNLALDRYRQGLDAFINVTDALMTVLEYANELVVARGNVLTSIITLRKAIF